MIMSHVLRQTMTLKNLFLFFNEDFFGLKTIQNVELSDVSIWTQSKFKHFSNPVLLIEFINGASFCVLCSFFSLEHVGEMLIFMLRDKEWSKLQIKSGPNYKMNVPHLVYYVVTSYFWESVGQARTTILTGIHMFFRLSNNNNNIAFFPKQVGVG